MVLMDKCVYCGIKINKKVFWQKFCSSECRISYFIFKKNITKIKKILSKHIKDDDIVSKILKDLVYKD